MNLSRYNDDKIFYALLGIIFSLCSETFINIFLIPICNVDGIDLISYVYITMYCIQDRHLYRLSGN